MSIGVLAAAVLAGALGGAHCIAMCGGFVAALAARDARHGVPLLPARTIAIGHAYYHVGRILTYAILGGGLGAAGGIAFLASAAAPIQRAAYIAGNIFLLALGATFVIRVPAVVGLQRAGMRFFAPALRALAPLARAPRAGGRLAMGLVWGLMPCALVYAVLPLALLAGGPLQGAAVMLAFGLGTLPNVLAGGVLVSRLRRRGHGAAIRLAGAFIIIAFGLFGLVRALLAPGALPLPFCLS